MLGSMRMCALLRPETTACVGYAMLLLASQMTLWGGLPLSENTGLALSQLLLWWSVPLCASIAAALIVIALLVPRGSFVLRDRFVLILSCVGHAVVLGAYCLVLLGPEGSVATTFIASAATGVGIGAASAAWIDIFARFDKGIVVLLIICSLMISAVLHLVANAFLSHVLISVFASTLVAAAFCSALTFRLLHASTSDSALPSNREGIEEMPEDSSLRILIRAMGMVRGSLYCAASIAFSVAITRMLTLAFSSSSAAVNDCGLAAVAMGSALLLLVGKRFKGFLSDRLSVPALFRILFPVVATLLLTLSIGGSSLGLFVGAAVFAIYSLVSVLMVPVCIEGAKSQSIPAISAYGVYAGLVHLSFAAATFLGVALLGGSAADRSLFLTCILMVLYVLAMAFALTQRQSTAKHDSVSNSRRNHEGDSGCGQESLRISSAGRADPIELRCAALSEQYGLSPRESEVLFAFAHGRNVAYLAGKLVLSENTIRSHSKTLYTKLGVHSKQELIDLVEGIYPDGGADSKAD